MLCSTTSIADLGWWILDSFPEPSLDSRTIKFENLEEDWELVGDKIGIKSKIIDQLTQTRKFAMIDRDFLGETDKELKLIQGGNFKIEEMARLGNQVGVDFILLPTVFQHKISKSVKTSKFSGKKFIVLTNPLSKSFREVSKCF